MYQKRVVVCRGKENIEENNYINITKISQQNVWWTINSFVPTVVCKHKYTAILQTINFSFYVYNMNHKMCTVQSASLRAVGTTTVTTVQTVALLLRLIVRPWRYRPLFQLQCGNIPGVVLCTGLRGTTPSQAGACGSYTHETTPLCSRLAAPAWKDRLWCTVTSLLHCSGIGNRLNLYALRFVQGTILQIVQLERPRRATPSDGRYMTIAHAQLCMAVPLLEIFLRPCH